MAWTNSAVAEATFTITDAVQIIGVKVEDESGAGLTGSGSGYEIFGRGVRIKHPDAGEPFKTKIKEV